MAELQLQNVSRTYGTFEAVKDVSLAIGDGEFAVFVGPSGCGKSTLLRLIAGLDPVSAGTIAIGSADMTARQAGERPVAMVFQSYALYPHMSVFENIAFPLQMEKRSKAEIRGQPVEAGFAYNSGTNSEWLSVAEIRALLLAAVRSALLWRQLGGSQWQFLFARRAMVESVARHLG